MYKGLPFGKFWLSPGDQLFHKAPINTITRGLWFDGNSGHVTIKNILLNTNFSLHSWVFFQHFGGNILEVETETPTTENEEQTLTYSCGESASNTEEADMGVTYNGGS
jgi:hypothetical protein